MKRASLRFGKGFRVRAGNAWLFVLSGTGTAQVNKRRYRLRAGSLVLIERGDEHQVQNTGRARLRTLNIYVPPAYDARGDELPRGRK